MKTIKIGDTVKVIDDGETYPSYDAMYTMFGFDHSMWKRHCNNHETGIVVGIKPHEHNRTQLIACVKLIGGYNLIGVEGLSYQQPKNPVVNYKFWHTGHTFAKPFDKIGKKANYFKILEFIEKNGSSTRQEIVYCIFDQNLKSRRSWYCGVFTALREAGLLNYDSKTRFWSKGQKFANYLEFANSLRKSV